MDKQQLMELLERLEVFNGNNGYTVAVQAEEVLRPLAELMPLGVTLNDLMKLGRETYHDSLVEKKIQEMKDEQTARQLSESSKWLSKLHDEAPKSSVWEDLPPRVVVDEGSTRQKRENERWVKENDWKGAAQEQTVIGQLVRQSEIHNRRLSEIANTAQSVRNTIITELGVLAKRVEEHNDQSLNRDAAIVNRVDELQELLEKRLGEISIEEMVVRVIKKKFQ